MKILIAVAAAGIVGGFAVASWFQSSQGEITAGVAPVAQESDARLDAGLSLEQRLIALEQALGEERAARQLLEEQLIFLMNDLQEMPAVAGQNEAVAADAVATSGTQRRTPRRSRESREDRTRRLIDAGFDAGRAEWIISRESSLQMEALQQRYEAGRSGTVNDFFRTRSGLRDALRDELGEQDFERYMIANGASINVGISSVLDSSPAQSAGLQIGDRIVSYDGKRVYNMYDLTQQTLTGVPGERIVMDILREGTAMQIVLPRGPVGVSGGR